ncbi:MAG: hypothetical protein KDB90_05375 [Planctomycetes bacterium]|nr:hypothetical protein [Planctomycetota bacterium]
MTDEFPEPASLSPYGNEGQLRERYSQCRRSASRNGAIGFGLAVLALLLGTLYFAINAMYGGGAPMFGALVIVFFLLPAWPFFRKKSALETESYAIERELKAVEQAKQGHGTTHQGPQQ